MTQVIKSTRSISEKEIVRVWHLVDMNNKVLGRETGKVADLLCGKQKVTYVPYLDSGDYVVVINAKNVKLTGSKPDQKEYKYYSGYPGGQKVVSYKQMKADKPEEIVHHAVAGMLPKNKHRDPRMARLFIYSGDKHPYEHKFTK